MPTDTTMPTDPTLLATFASHPLFWPAVTLGVFVAASVLYERTGKIAVLQPVLVAILVLSAALLVLGVPYGDYAEPMALFTLLLTPAIIALGVPLYRNLAKAREQAGMIAATIVGGGTLVIVSALLLGRMAGLDEAHLLPLATKSVSAPIAIGIADKTGAAVTLTILAVFTTGLPGAAFTPSLLRALRIRDEAIRGLVLGVTSHAFGIARATEIGERATAFATIGMALMGCFAAIAVPVIVRLLAT